METARLWLLFHFASGQAYFSGAAILLAAVGLSPWILSRWPRSLRMGAMILAAALIGLSAVPAPWLVYLALAAATVAWLVLERVDREAPGRRLLFARSAAAMIAMAAVLFELPWHLPVTIPSSIGQQIDVLGDSITAGAGETEIVRWPNLLAERRQLVVIDHAQMGATARIAMKQADKIDPSHTLVLVEIGGNDLLGNTTLADFEVNLQKLLAKVCRPGRMVMMFELPLPPSYNRWGMIQRKVAREFGVSLIPRRVLAGVILAPGNTSDSIHLTQAGHAALAEAVWRAIAPAEQRD